jgi:hypothetical protein
MTITVKPLAWREIDPGMRYVGTGVGFVCEVARMHSGLWAFTSAHGRADILSKDAAMQRAQDVYEALIRSALVLPVEEAT